MFELENLSNGPPLRYLTRQCMTRLGYSVLRQGLVKREGGLVNRRRRCDTLCTSGLVDDVHDGPYVAGDVS